MALNHQQLVEILASSAHESVPFSLHIFDTLPSTNQKLWELINQGAGAGTVVIAAQQTAGRGQWGRQWSSPPGGLYLTLALTPDLSASQSYQLTICSAWGIAMALRSHGIPVHIKWPNDLMLGDRKLGGILTETKVKQGRITKAVIGVGINWANSVPETGIDLQSFQANQRAMPISSLEMLAAITLRGIAYGNELCFQQGIDTLLPSYQKLLTSVGRLVSVNGRSGIVVGVNATGELRVRLCPAEGYRGAKDEMWFSPTGTLQEGGNRSSERSSREEATSSEAAPEILLKPGTISLGYG